ncbi:MAG: hypothetical protein R2941_22740 [Desulfobacterales bacterium]
MAEIDKAEMPETWAAVMNAKSTNTHQIWESESKRRASQLCNIWQMRSKCIKEILTVHTPKPFRNTGAFHQNNQNALSEQGSGRGEKEGKTAFTGRLTHTGPL